PFPVAVRLTTGKWLLTVYREANQELSALWQQQLQGLQFTSLAYLHQRKENSYVDYHTPQPHQDGGTLALKSSLSTVSHFVRIDERKHEKKLFTPGAVEPEVGFSVAQDRMVWVEVVADRFKAKKSLNVSSKYMSDCWTSQGCYSVIKSYNMSTKKLTTLTHKSRYGAAALSSDATKIVAVESDMSYNHSLVILDADTGQVLKRLPNPKNYFYRTPQWADDGRHIVAIKSVPPTSTIVYIDTHTDRIRELLPYAEAHVSKPTMHGQYVFYSSNYSGIDNIYAIDIATGQRYQVTCRKYGAYHPAVSKDGRWLLFNDFTKDGMHAAQMPIVPAQWKPIEQIEDRSIHYYQPMVDQEAAGDVFAQVPDNAHPVERYYPWMRLINFCGWHLDPYIGPDRHNTAGWSYKLEIAAKFQDILETCAIRPIYRHDFKNEEGTFVVESTYTGAYPTFIFRPSLSRDYAKGITTNKILRLGIKCPLLLDFGQFTHKFSLGTSTDLYARGNATWSTQKYVFEALRYARGALRDMLFPWRQDIHIAYLHTPWGSTVGGSQFLTQMSLYFPGIRQNQSIHLQGSCNYIHAPQLALFDQWLYNRKVPQAFKKDWKSNTIMYGKVAYALPLWYPDWDLPPLLYVKRIQLTGSYEQHYYPRIAPVSRHQNQYVGVDLSTVTCFPMIISLPVHFEIGLKWRYRVNQPSYTRYNKQPSRLRFGFILRVL
ncbi:MAG: hypothetical protein AAFP93_02895, partial [Bacteroidota bacterium]